MGAQCAYCSDDQQISSRLKRPCCQPVKKMAWDMDVEPSQDLTDLIETHQSWSSERVRFDDRASIKEVEAGMLESLATEWKRQRSSLRISSAGPIRRSSCNSSIHSVRQKQSTKHSEIFDLISNGSFSELASMWVRLTSEEVRDQDGFVDDDELFDGESSTQPVCLKRSALVRDMLPFVSVENPDDINHVYIFSGEVLSEGGETGISQKASVKVTGAYRAVKFVPKSLSEDKMALFRRSIDITAAFDHPNVMHMHEIFEDADYVYLVMSYCPGGTLFDLLKQGVLSEVKVVIVTQQILRAVDYLHSNHVMHRDVRTQNILFNSSPGTVTSTSLIRVASFGATCRILKGEVLAPNVGFPGYRAPETCTAVYSKEIDIWSCGVVMFEMLYGRLPFPVGTRFDERKTKLQFVSDAGNVSASAQDLLSQLLEVNPKQRVKLKVAMSHKWFQKVVSKLGAVPFDASTLAQLKDFRKQSPFLQAALRIVASSLSDDETANSRKLFIYLDQNGDGNLVPSELQIRIANDPQIKEAYPDISEIFQHVDHDDKFRQLAFTYTEFVAATFDRDKCLTEPVCRLAFRCFDRNRDGTITISELEKGHLLRDLSAQKLGQAFESVDANGDRKIDFQEFMLVMRRAHLVKW